VLALLLVTLPCKAGAHLDKVDRAADGAAISLEAELDVCLAQLQTETVGR
jgi:hypothetical protein